jgi:hypothetical protein
MSEKFVSKEVDENEDGLYYQRVVQVGSGSTSGAVDSLFNKVHRINSGVLRCGDRGGQIPRSTIRSPKKSCKTAVVAFAVWAVTHT